MERKRKREMVERFWEERGIKFPHFPENAAFLARPVATCRVEDLYFEGLSLRAGLEPVWGECSEERVEFFTYGYYKCHRRNYRGLILAPRIIEGFGKKGGFKIKKKRFFFPSHVEWRKISSLKSVVEFHHWLWKGAFSGRHRFDVSPFLGQFWTRSLDEYGIGVYFLSWFVAHATFIENLAPELGSQRINFLGLEKKIRSSSTYQKVVRVFGAPPLIVRVPWRRGIDFFVNMKKINSRKEVVDKVF